MRHTLFLLLCGVAASCAQPREGAAPAPAATPAQPGTASALPLRTMGFSALPGWGEADARAALSAFRRSCPSLLRREDLSGLTDAEDWRDACRQAAGAADARAFFEAHFTPVVVGEGTGLNTGYFEPEIAGSRARAPGYEVPLYRKPGDIIEVDLGQFSDELKGRRIRGRIEEGALVPYPDRAAIEDGALAGRGLELAWAADPIEAFFLEIQGSGRLRLPDGRIMRVGYAGQNGHAYTAIGALLRERGVFQPGEATMERIVAWLRANPEEGRRLMRENRSYVFFREVEGEGPIGAMNVALTPEVSVAADPRYLPLGAPVWLDTSVPEGGRLQPRRKLTIAQDTGGAIKGPNRLDLFWGAGPRARAIAGELQSQGRAVVLLPNPAAERLRASDRAA